ncbi:cupin domain-containing protein [Terrarubrum flagellatum]|uniref:cupin domain-containing protein n=1 Tax=Terrirubrum flagellatum TaxID=2895980 RepID=UPI0031455D5E
MSVFHQNEAPPGWCELKAFEILDLKPGDEPVRRCERPKTRALCTGGTVQLRHGDGSTVLKETQFLDLHLLGGSQEWRARACSPTAQLVVLAGDWGDDISGCGVFRVANDENATNTGDPVSYPKKTRVDSHYHDCDEYWIILEGRATVVVGDASMDMRPGDCVSIGMGHHHDMPLAPEPVKAVFFETTLERDKRIGHLWNHTHGPARPHPERV